MGWLAVLIGVFFLNRTIRKAKKKIQKLSGKPENDIHTTINLRCYDIHLSIKKADCEI